MRRVLFEVKVNFDGVDDLAQRNHASNDQGSTGRKRRTFDN